MNINLKSQKFKVTNKNLKTKLWMQKIETDRFKREEESNMNKNLKIGKNYFFIILRN